MAIGNPFNGTLRGRLGESVFSRKAGAQHVRAYVSNPANPQSTRQLAQRVKFGTAAKFYQHGVQNLFKFAFEFKKASQDDYNSFLKANIGNVPCNTRKGYNAGLPNLGSYIMSQGSLAPIQISWGGRGGAGNEAALITKPVAGEYEDVTIADLSRSMIEYYHLQNGDFITIAVLTCAAEPAQDIERAKAFNALCEFEPSYPTLWKVKQFMLDTDNMGRVENLEIFSGKNTEGDLFFLAGPLEYDDPSCCGVCVMASRNTSRGVKVSTSRLVCNQATKATIDACLSDEWTEYCATTFNESSLEYIPEDDILQGSISENTPMVNAVYSGSLPVELKFTDLVSQGFLGVTLKDYTYPNIKGYQFIVDGVAMEYRGSVSSGSTTYYQFLASEIGYDIDVDASNGRVYGISNKQGRMLTGIRVKK